MSSEKRPGGLTALAVFNFIFGALEIVGAVSWVAMLRFSNAALEGASPDTRKIIEAFQHLGTGLFVVIVLASLVSGALLIASGIGYLKLKKFLGRSLGNAYAILGVASTLMSSLLMPAELGGGFSLGSLVGLIYPVLTLILLNVVFKEDFDR